MGSRPPQHPHSPIKAPAATKPIRNEGRKSSGDGAGCWAPGGDRDRPADSSLLQGLRARPAPKRGTLWGPGVPPHTPRVAHTQRPAQAPASHRAGPMLRKRRPTPKCSRCKVPAQNGKTRELPTNPHASRLGAKLFLQKALPAPIPNFHRTHEPRSDPGPRLCS